MFVLAIINHLPLFFANHCRGNTFFFLPPWWRYIDTQHDATGGCEVLFDFPDDIWAVALAVIDMLLMVGGIVAVIMIIVAGVSYIMSAGNPEKTTAAKNRIINSLIGLGVVLVASAAVSFIGNTLIN